MLQIQPEEGGKVQLRAPCPAGPRAAPDLFIGRACELGLVFRVGVGAEGLVTATAQVCFRGKNLY